MNALGFLLYFTQKPFSYLLQAQQERFFSRPHRLGRKGGTPHGTYDSNPGSVRFSPV